ncbi:hypothetical protein FDECE_9837 [Fusarium decemcellulare]|nr:hypothetical protein FDECE_9837 [Fusarium decemcellulare]
MSSSIMQKMDRIFNTRSKLPIHLIQVALVIAVISLSGARLLMKNTPPGRSTTMGLGMGAKSLVIIGYQLLTEHVHRLKRWGSLKAYWILNALEIVFWAAVAFMMLQGNRRMCIGTSCILGWVVLALAVIMSMLAKFVAVVGFLDWQHFRKTGVPRGSELKKCQDEGSLSTLETLWFGRHKI